MREGVSQLVAALPAVRPVPAAAAPNARAVASEGSAARVLALDGLRGVAIGLVVFYHLIAMTQPWATPSLLNHALWKVTGSGWAGVDLFFVLSGFLITGILYDAKGPAKSYFRSFFARRVLRIFPLYYVFLFALIFALPLVLPDARASAESVWHSMGWYGTYTMNVRTAFDHGPHADVFYTGHLWSLAVEEQFYLVWPFVVLALNRRALVGACGVAIVAALGLRFALDANGASQDLTYGFMPARMDALAVGALIALVVRDEHDLRIATRWLAPGAALAFAGLLAVVAWRGDLIPPFDRVLVTVGLSFLALVFGAVLLSVVIAKPTALPRRVLSHAVLVSMGRYSYALYLFHLPVGMVLLQRTHLHEHLPKAFGSTLPGIAVFVACGALLTLALAVLSWNLLEKQCFKLKRFFPYSLVEPAEPAEERPVAQGGVPRVAFPARTD